MEGLVAGIGGCLSAGVEVVQELLALNRRDEEEEEWMTVGRCWRKMVRGRETG